MLVYISGATVILCPPTFADIICVPETLRKNPEVNSIKSASAGTVTSSGDVSPLSKTIEDPTKTTRSKISELLDELDELLELELLEL